MPKLFTLAQSHLQGSDGSREHRFMAAAAAAVPGDDESTFWPQIQNAVDWLRGRQVLTDRQLSRLISESEVGGLAAADQQRAALNDRLNRAIQDSILTGDSHGSWQQRASQIVDLTARETEAIGRTFTHRAYHEGLKEIAEEPAIRDEFPYVQWMATHDTRVRPEHAVLDGKVAHVGSPLHQKFETEIGAWNCRCSLVPLSRDDAVAAGIDDNTGWVEPSKPEPTSQTTANTVDDDEGISLVPAAIQPSPVTEPLPVTVAKSPEQFMETFFDPEPTAKTLTPAKASVPDDDEDAISLLPQVPPEPPAKPQTAPAPAPKLKPISTPVKAQPAPDPDVTAKAPKKSKTKTEPKSEPKAEPTKDVIKPSITPAKKPKSGWPDLGDLSPVKSLGGATGARLVKDSRDTLYVQKFGSSPGHVIEESIADSLYAKAGVNVPSAKLLQPNGQPPVKLTKFIEGKSLADFAATATKTQLDKVHKELQKDFAIDALLGNRDVIGTNHLTGGFDNILVDTKGKVWRIDNGGALRFGGMGQKKDWGAEVREFDGLRNASLNPQAAKVFGGMSNQDLINSIDRATEKRAAILRAAPADVKQVLQKRFEWLANKRDELIASELAAAKPKVMPTAKATPAKAKPISTPAAKATPDGLETKITTPGKTTPAGHPVILDKDLQKSRAKQPSEITDLHDEIAKSQKSTALKMTMGQKRAIKDYAYGEFASINHALRDKGRVPDSFTAENVKNIQDAIASAGKLEKPIVTYRGMKGEHASAMLPKMIQAIQDNVPVKLSGITSSSLDPEIAAEFGAANAGDGIIFEIQPSTGMYISGMHGLEPTPAQKKKGDYMFTLAYGVKERELLQNHNTHYKVRKIRTQVPVSEFVGGNFANDNRRVTVVQLMEIDPGDPKAMQLANAARLSGTNRLL